MHAAKPKNPRRQKAEGEAESKALQGQGIANQRRAIIEGLQSSIEQFQKVVGSVSAAETMQLVLVTQYLIRSNRLARATKPTRCFSRIRLLQ